jgi:peptide/nickel transport system substrate-binding protein
MGGRDIDALASVTGLGVAPLKVALQAEIVFNTKTGPTADPKVRKALRLAYDYAGGLKSIRSGRGTIANGVLPNTMNCRPDLPLVKQDLAAAKKLLAEAGVKDLSIKMSFQPVFEEQKQEATLFQSNAEEIGVKVELVPITFPNYLASLKNVDSIPSMMLLTDFAQFPDPGVVLVKGYKSDAIGTNRTAFADPEVDRLLDQALASSDAAVRCDIYKKVQTILDEKSVMIDMYTLTNNVVFRSTMLKEPAVSPVVSPLALADLRLVKAP